MGEWQPIETAPNSGEFLVYDAFWKEVVAVYRSDGGSLIPIMGGRDPDYADDATHWMPLPPAPSSGERVK